MPGRARRTASVFARYPVTQRQKSWHPADTCSSGPRSPEGFALRLTGEGADVRRSQYGPLPHRSLAVGVDERPGSNSPTSPSDPSWIGTRFGLYLPAVGPSPPKSSEPEIEPRVGIDDTAFAANASEPGSFTRSLGHAVSWAGGHAMRPQTAMAAVLLLMLGSSLVFLRVRPEQGASARVSIVERGVPDRNEDGASPSSLPLPSVIDLRRTQGALPETDRVRPEHAATAPKSAGGLPSSTTVAAPPSKRVEAENPHAQASALTSAAAPPADVEAPKADTREGGDAYAAAMALYRSGHYAEAARDFELIAGSDAKNAQLAALYAAKSVQAGSGCQAAVSKYEAVASRFEKTPIEGDALWGAASCHKAIGNFKRARELYLSLRPIAGYRDRAEKEIATLDTMIGR